MNESLPSSNATHPDVHVMNDDTSIVPPPPPAEPSSLVTTTTTTMKVVSQEQQPVRHIRPTKSKRIITTTSTTPPTSVHITTTERTLPLQQPQPTTKSLSSNAVVQSILRKSPKYTKSSLSSFTDNTAKLDITTTTTPGSTIITDNTNHHHHLNNNLSEKDETTKTIIFDTTSTNESIDNSTSMISASSSSVQLPKIQQDHVVERPRDSRRRRRHQHTSHDTTTDTTTTTASTISNTSLLPENIINGDVEGYIPHTIEKVRNSLPPAPATSLSTTTTTLQPHPQNNTKTMISDSDDMKHHSNIDETTDHHAKNDTPGKGGDDDDDDDIETPLIFNSLADMMEMAGTLPSSIDANSTTTMIETQLDFSVIDPMDYQQQQNEIFYGITSVPPHETIIEHDPMSKDEKNNNNIDLPTDNDQNGTIAAASPIDSCHDNEETHDSRPDSSQRKSIRERFTKPNDDDNDDQYSYTTEESNILDSDDDSDDDDDDVLMDALKHHTHHRMNDTETTSSSPPPPRAFIFFWNTISQWVTPSAVEFICQLRNVNRATNNETNGSMEPQQQLHKMMTYQQPNDIALSRCHGLMNIIQLQTSRCWTEYMNINGRYDNDTNTNNDSPSSSSSSLVLLRHAEQNVATLLRCMDYTHPTPKFNTIQIRALTCILLDMVMNQTSMAAPPAHSNISNDSPSSHQHSSMVPLPCSTLGMTWEEYNYLVQSSIISFR